MILKYFISVSNSECLQDIIFVFDQNLCEYVMMNSRLALYDKSFNVDFFLQTEDDIFWTFAWWYNLHWDVYFHTSFSDLDLLSRPQGYQKGKSVSCLYSVNAYNYQLHSVFHDRNEFKGDNGCISRLRKNTHIGFFSEYLSEIFQTLHDDNLHWNFTFSYHFQWPWSV